MTLIILSPPKLAKVLLARLARKTQDFKIE
jgi:hypothetical protein